MTRDDSTGGWVPMGGGGMSIVGLRKLIVSNGEDLRHEYHIHGQRIQDQSVSSQTLKGACEMGHLPKRCHFSYFFFMKKISYFLFFASSSLWSSNKGLILRRDVYDQVLDELKDIETRNRPVSIQSLRTMASSERDEAEANSESSFLVPKY